MATNDIQRLMIRGYGAVYMFYVIDWSNYKSWFAVSCGLYEEHYDNACAAEECFNRMCKQRR